MKRAAQLRDRAEHNDDVFIKTAYLRQAEVWLYLADSDPVEGQDDPDRQPSAEP